MRRASWVFLAWVPLSALASEIDYLNLANGAVPVAYDEAATALRVDASKALQLIDGHPGGFVLTPKPVSGDQSFSVTFRLPAETTFAKFVVPNVLETPSPSQTFVKNIQFTGSTLSASEGFGELARVALSVHDSKGEETIIAVTQAQPIRWLRVTFSGGLDVQREQTFLEFSELKGFGTQAAVPTEEGFAGSWKGRGVKMQLNQEGALVNGCYDTSGELQGSVTGSVLKATGTASAAQIPSSFVLLLDDQGDLIGVRSTNGAPFQIQQANTHIQPVTCAEPAEPSLGCGSIVHGINFDFDSATLQPDATPILKKLHEGLSATEGHSIVIEGHTSSEGDETYNQGLSERRAGAVVDALVDLGIPSNRLLAAGIGEVRPIANNDTEAGRALNRRVEIKCGDL